MASLPAVDIAIPLFGYQNHISIDRGFGFIRKWARAMPLPMRAGCCAMACSTRPTRQVGCGPTPAIAHRRTRAFIARNMALPAMFTARSPRARPMPEAVRRANNAKSKVRARVEHVFAEQKDRMDLFITHHRHRPRARSRSA